mmetsp:Transcript_13711/g.18288  ORF Transcript_13711/g.18288 Transcript_13711/m.18288 type:complete len:129 (+) Transcript_13711:33-419(+)
MIVIVVLLVLRSFFIEAFVLLVRVENKEKLSIRKASFSSTLYEDQQRALRQMAVEEMRIMIGNENECCLPELLAPELQPDPEAYAAYLERAKKKKSSTTRGKGMIPQQQKKKKIISRKEEERYSRIKY